MAVLIGRKFKHDLRENPQNYGRYMKWKLRVVNLMWLLLIKKLTSVFSLTVHLKARQAVEAYAMTMKLLIQERKINLKIVPCVWLMRWV